MILQALAGYYDRLVKEGIADLEPLGFKRVYIPFIFVIDPEGNFVGIDDTRIGEAKKKEARSFMVPKIFEGSRTSNVKANLLWDKVSYVFGVGPKTKPERLVKQKEAFRRTILDYFPESDSVKHVRAVLMFLDNPASAFNHPSWNEIATTDPNVAFRLEGETELICNKEVVQEAIVRKMNYTGGGARTCLITGRLELPVRLENPIKGLRGSGKAESHWVAFNEPAYWSYSKERGANAPIGKSASKAYISAFNYLQHRDSRQFIVIGDSTTVFWAERQHQFETAFADLFGEPAKGELEQDYKNIIALFRSPEMGARADLDPNTKFYVLGLAPNAARIAVRFWWAGTVGQIADNIGQHFDDLEIVKGKQEWRTLSLNSILCSTALESRDVSKKNLVYHHGKFFDVAPNLAGDTMKAILSGTPYPQTLLASVARRMKAEQSRKDSKGRSIQNVNYTRAALIKAVLSRDTRLDTRNVVKKGKEVGMSLDDTNTNPGYLLGRLFAVLEKVQEEANPGISATIRDRFYGSASGTPVTAFPQLMKLKNHHMAKLENRGRATNLEKQIGEIIDKLEAGDSFPSHLSLADQGRFAVGYYHQRQDLFTKKEKEEKSE
ncbi:MAG: type I-C CRISPR-associated protein Cas8c/Csd1 [Dehalococcoidia bacterium]